MQGLITLDFGNTNPHAGIFFKADGDWSLEAVVPLAALSGELENRGFAAHNASVVVCEVRARENEITRLQKEGFLVTRVRDYWRGTRFAGMPVNYAKTLGEDRLILAYHCYKKEKAPTLIIDAGTFVTLDVVTDAGFLGGYICPGITAYFELYQRGEKLKDTPPGSGFFSGLPRETEHAISGSYGAFAALAKRLIYQHNIRKVVITGGSSRLWETFFEEEKQTLVVESSPHLIHWALNHWMTTQIEPL